MALAVKAPTPDLFAALRRKVIPFLRTYPSINVWLVGCEEADEPYWTALALFEAELYHRSRIFVTDPDAEVLAHSSERGEDERLSRLRQRITFFHYDTATNASFNEFQLVLVRASVTPRGFDVVHDSLCYLGVLGLGPVSNIHASLLAPSYELLDVNAQLFRRVR